MRTILQVLSLLSLISAYSCTLAYKAEQDTEYLETILKHRQAENKDVDAKKPKSKSLSVDELNRRMGEVNGY